MLKPKWGGYKLPVIKTKCETCMRASKVDANQGEIVRALRSVGCSVQSLASVGRGVPDLLVGHKGNNYLLEVKDGKKAKSAQRLTADQVDWHNSWVGGVYVVNSVQSAFDVLGISIK